MAKDFSTINTFDPSTGVFVSGKQYGTLDLQHDKQDKQSILNALLDAIRDGSSNALDLLMDQHSELLQSYSAQANVVYLKNVIQAMKQQFHPCIKLYNILTFYMNSLLDLSDYKNVYDNPMFKIWEFGASHKNAYSMNNIGVLYLYYYQHTENNQYLEYGKFWLHKALEHKSCSAILLNIAFMYELMEDITNMMDYYNLAYSLFPNDLALMETVDELEFIY